MNTAVNPITAMLRRYELTVHQFAKVLELDVFHAEMLVQHGRDIPTDVLKTLETMIIERREWRGADEGGLK